MRALKYATPPPLMPTTSNLTLLAAFCINATALPPQLEGPSLAVLEPRSRRIRNLTQSNFLANSKSLLDLDHCGFGKVVRILTQETEMDYARLWAGCEFEENLIKASDIPAQSGVLVPVPPQLPLSPSRTANGISKPRFSLRKLDSRSSVTVVSLDERAACPRALRLTLPYAFFSYFPAARAPVSHAPGTAPFCQRTPVQQHPTHRLAVLGGPGLATCSLPPATPRVAAQREHAIRWPTSTLEKYGRGARGYYCVQAGQLSITELAGAPDTLSQKQARRISRCGHDLRWEWHYT
ncbi:hypothetical protein EDB84DRAFT_1600617 [Lactarius hengduanensis]|nr:hypothetical protein EDB84DRAFT_1600617 [Lactarius hengduanensis]